VVMWIRIATWGHVDFGLWSCGLGLQPWVMYLRFSVCGHVVQVRGLWLCGLGLQPGVMQLRISVCGLVV